VNLVSEKLQTVIDKDRGMIRFGDGEEMFIVPDKLEVTVEEFFDLRMPHWVRALLEQLEQAQQANKCPDCGGSGRVELCHDPLYTERCICTYDPASLIIEISELRRQLEQAQVEASKWRKQAHEEIELGESIVTEREELYAEIEKAKKTEQALINEVRNVTEHNQTLKGENFTLRRSNQKLVEALEYYANKNNYIYEVEYTGDIEEIWEDIEIRMNPDRGEIARQTLSEVKGNGDT